MSRTYKKQTVTLKLIAQLAVILLGAFAVKQYYSTANVNQLRWILAPTTFLVEIVNGEGFEFEPYAGYASSDRRFVIAASCSGVNFLITAFLMLSLRKLWRDRAADRSDNSWVQSAWMFIPAAGAAAYLATLVANTVRISTALRLRELSFEVGGLTGGQLHRLEGIFIYFGFLMLLFMVSEKMNSGSRFISHGASKLKDPFGLPSPVPSTSQLRQLVFPLLMYYSMTLGIPFANVAYRGGASATNLWEHSVFVLLTPLILILPLVATSFYRSQRGSTTNDE